LPPKRWRGIGRPPSLIRRDDKHKPVSASKWRWDCRSPRPTRAS